MNIIDKLEGLMPGQLKDGTFAEEDYRMAFALEEAIALVREAFEGHTLVPDEPTVEMNNGGNVALTKGYQQGLIQSSDIYRAMLKAQGVNE